MSQPLERMCVLAEPYLSRTEVRSLEYAIEHTGITIPLVVVNDPGDSDYDPEMEAEAVNSGIGWSTVKLFFEVLKRERAWTFVIAERKLAERMGADAASSERIPIEDVSCLSTADIQRVEPETDGNWSTLPADTVQLVRDTCDVVLRYGFGLIEGEILTATEYGVLSFHPADIRRYRGMGPPQAFLDGRDTMGLTLQRLNEDIDGGEIVAYEETDVSECATLWEVYDALDEIQVQLLATGIQNLRDPETAVTVPDSLGPYYSVQTRRSPFFAGRVLYKNVAGRLKRRL